MTKFIYGCIDVPIDNAELSTSCVVSGWCWAREGIVAVELFVGQLFYSKLVYGIRREGIQAVIPGIDVDCGFYGDIDLSGYNPGTYELIVYVLIRGGVRFVLSKKKIIVNNNILPANDECVGKHILVACFPKSGSSYLTGLLSNITGFSVTQGVFEYGQNEQDVYLPSLARNRYVNSVSQQHVRATDTNIRLLKQFDYMVVLLLRNIFDVVISYYDHLHKESIKVPTCYFDQSFFLLSDGVKLDQIIDMVLPWYISFYVSWMSVVKNNLLVVKSLTYEKLLSDKEAVLLDLMNYLGVDVTLDHLRSSIDNSDARRIRYNIGRAGRGEELLTKEQVTRIRKYTDYYPDVDFSIIGL